MLTSIVAAVVILGLLVLVHEAGHFVVAKRIGVRVMRFSIGYPPKIFGIRRGETEYAVGATPFGGYVRMLGDEVGEEPGPSGVQTYLQEISKDLLAAGERTSNLKTAAPDANGRLLALARRVAGAEGAQALPAAGGAPAWPEQPEGLGTVDPKGAAALEAVGRALREEEVLLLEEINRRGSVDAAIDALGERQPPALIRPLKRCAFPSQSLAKRFAIVLAGPAANVLFAPVLLTVIFMYGVPRLLPIVGQVKKGLPAEKAGLREGDRVVSIDGKPVTSWEDLSALVRGSRGRPLTIDLERRNQGRLERGAAVISPSREEARTIYGDSTQTWIIGVTPRGDAQMQRVGPIRALGRAVIESGRITAMLIVGIVKIIDGSTPVREALGGPILIAQLAGRQAQEGFPNVALFTVMLSLQLGIINLLPVPMLDGGHLLFFAVEGLRGKPLQVRHREIAQQVGLFILVVLMAFVIFNDISRIVQG